MTEEEYFRKTYPNSCYGDRPLSPYWDFFQDGVEFGERQSEKKIEELEETINKLREQLALRYSLEDKIKELKKENTEWEKFVKDIQNRNEKNYLKVCHKLATELNRGVELADQLTKAKEIIKGWLGDYYSPKAFYTKRAELVEQSEQFLKE